jgi:hypothetical protein
VTLLTARTATARASHLHKAIAVLEADDTTD